MWNKKVIPVPILRRNFANVPYNPYGNTIPMPYSKPAGPVCRSGNSGITATVFGSYGFLGRYLANDLGLFRYEFTSIFCDDILMKIFRIDWDKNVCPISWM